MEFNNEILAELYYYRNLLGDYNLLSRSIHIVSIILLSKILGDYNPTADWIPLTSIILLSKLLGGYNLYRLRQ